MAETLEILYELDELDANIWRLVSSVIDAYYEKVAQVSQQEIKEMREQLWNELERP